MTRPDGTRGRKWIYGRTRAEVAAELARLAQRVDSGAVVPTRSPTLSEYLTYWLTEVVAPGAPAHDRGEVPHRHRALPASRPRAATASTSSPSRSCSATSTPAAPRGDSVAKLEMIKVVLSSALSCAMREELVTRNVAQLVTLPTEQRARRTAWTAAQARVFLRAAVDDPAYPVFVLALVYGLRRGEIAALRWEDVDFSGGRLFIRASLVRVDGRLVRGPVKSAAGVRALPLVALSRAALLAARDRQTEQRTAAACPSTSPTGRRPATCSPRAAAARSSRATSPAPSTASSTAAGLPSIVFHDLRRTAATMLKSLGVPARDAQTILGHANIAVTLGVYSEVFDTEIATALGRINDALGGEPDPSQPRGADRSPTTPSATARQPTKADVGAARLRCCRILCQTASPKIGRGRFRWWAILGLNQ